MKGLQSIITKPALWVVVPKFPGLLDPTAIFGNGTLTPSRYQSVTGSKQCYVSAAVCEGAEGVAIAPLLSTYSVPQYHRISPAYGPP